MYLAFIWIGEEMNELSVGSLVAVTVVVCRNELGLIDDETVRGFVIVKKRSIRLHTFVRYSSD